MSVASWFVTGDEEADHLVATDPGAFLVGMLLDQQVPLEWAFRGPSTLRARLGTIEIAALAARDEGEIVAAACARPAIHRFPAALGRRIHALAVALVGRGWGDPAQLWATAPDAAELLARLRALPGFGEEKARITIAALGKRFGVELPGWVEAGAPFTDDQPRSVADCGSPAGLAAVRAWKAAARRSGLDKQDRPLPAASRAAPRVARSTPRAAREGPATSPTIES